MHPARVISFFEIISLSWCPLAIVDIVWKNANSACMFYRQGQSFWDSRSYLPTSNWLYELFAAVLSPIFSTSISLTHELKGLYCATMLNIFTMCCIFDMYLCMCGLYGSPAHVAFIGSCCRIMENSQCDMGLNAMIVDLTLQLHFSQWFGLISLAG